MSDTRTEELDEKIQQMSNQVKNVKKNYALPQSMPRNGMDSVIDGLERKIKKAELLREQLRSEEERKKVLHERPRAYYPSN